MRLTGCQLSCSGLGHHGTIDWQPINDRVLPHAQILAVPFAKTALKLIVNCFYTVKGFDDNGKGMLVGHTCVSIFILSCR
jgi:hypothetical protein